MGWFTSGIYFLVWPSVRSKQKFLLRLLKIDCIFWLEHYENTDYILVTDFKCMISIFKNSWEIQIRLSQWTQRSNQCTSMAIISFNMQLHKYAVFWLKCYYLLHVIYKQRHSNTDEPKILIKFKNWTNADSLLKTHTLQAGELELEEGLTWAPWTGLWECNKTLKLEKISFKAHKLLEAGLWGLTFSGNSR